LGEGIEQQASANIATNMSRGFFQEVQELYRESAVSRDKQRAKQLEICYDMLLEKIKSTARKEPSLLVAVGDKGEFSAECGKRLERLGFDVKVGGDPPSILIEWHRGVVSSPPSS
jgi:hypothetical protein